MHSAEFSTVVGCAACAVECGVAKLAHFKSALCELPPYKNILENVYFTLSDLREAPILNAAIIIQHAFQMPKGEINRWA